MPNLIFLMADQLRFDMLGAYGDHQCDTPNLDALTEQSTVFEQHHTPCPLCVPARSSLMTGLYPYQHGATINGWLREERSHGMVREGLDLLPNRLSDAGYHVIHAGVQHVRLAGHFEKACDRTRFIGPLSAGRHHRDLRKRGLMLPDMDAFRDPVVEHNQEQPITTVGTSSRTAVWPLRKDLFYDATLTRRMVRAIDKHDTDQPLCLMGMFWLPHPPLWVPRHWAHLKHPEQVQLPETIGQWYPGMPALQLSNLPGQLGSHVPIEHWAHVWALYMGMVTMLDSCIGEITDALKRQNMFDDTVIVFTSDHGEMLGSHRLYQKMCLYDEAVRVPLLVKTPGQKNARRVSEMSDHLDLTATLLDYAGQESINDSSGRSLRSLAEGHPNNRPRRELFAAYDGNSGRGYRHRMIRTSTHKFIHNVGDHPELYDMIEDPHETRNFAGNPKVAPLQNRLAEKLNHWLDQMNDDQPRAPIMDIPAEEEKKTEPSDE